MRIALALLLLASFAPAQEKEVKKERHLVKQAVFNAIATEYSGEMAQENTRHLIQYHRIQGSPMMAQAAEQVVLARLKQYGIEASLEKFVSDGKTKYQTHISPMSWDMKGGELWVESVGGMKDFEPFRLCRYSDVPMCVSTYSKGGEWSGELVDVGSGTADADYAGKDLKGKVALASGYAANVVRKAVLQYGAVGVVIYPAADDRPEHPDLIRYNGIWPRAEEYEKTSGGFQISANQYTKLKELMASGPVRVRGKIDATLGAGEMTLVHAYIRGTKDPQQEVLVTAHLDHPKWSANDNASGSGGMIELARALKALIDAKKIPAPERSIHFMWVPEFFGTMAYVTKHPEARRCGDWDDPRQTKKWTEKDPCIIANINLDMIGEDTVKTNSRFYATRSPESVDGYLDIVVENVMKQTRAANLYSPTGTRQYWQPEMINYTQGSDHDVFNGLGVPSSMFGHDPDWTHHSSEDQIDKTDASEFRRVGTLAGVVAWWLTSKTASMQELDRLNHFGGGGHYGNRPLPIYLRGVNLRHFKHTPSPLKRLTVLPIYGAALESISGDDRKWWSEQQIRFAHVGEGLATEADFNLIAYEAVNFIDGKKDYHEIADVLSDEYSVDIDEAWVKRLLEILEKQGLVTTR